MLKRKFKPGDIVEVLQPSEIIKTLDEQGAMDNLPFMSEMIQYCGKKFKIQSLNEKTCIECLYSKDCISNSIREFNINDVVLLENIRCDGTSHGNCQTGCMIFWKEAWLSIFNPEDKNIIINNKEIDELKARLKAKINDKHFYCQLTQVEEITSNIGTKRRLIKLFKDVKSGEIEIYIAIKAILNPFIKKLKKIWFKIFFEDYGDKTPVDILNLQPGEIVEVKSLAEILKTLDKHRRNKGLEFNYGMRKYCGKKFMVRNRLERMINETTGKMIEINNTVILENVECLYEYRGFGCPRARFQFWREIWLKRIEQ